MKHIQACEHIWMCLKKKFMLNKIFWLTVVAPMCHVWRQYFSFCEFSDDNLKYSSPDLIHMSTSPSPSWGRNGSCLGIRNIMVCDSIFQDWFSSVNANLTIFKIGLLNSLVQWLLDIYEKVNSYIYDGWTLFWIMQCLSQMIKCGGNYFPNMLD